MFKHSFGIIVGDQLEPREVLLAFRKPQSQYILTLPLHPSQTKIEETENEVVFRLHLYITEDFVQELVSHGPRLRVLQPQSLIREVKTYHQQALDLYLGKRSEEHTSELQSRPHLVCRLLLEKKKKKIQTREQ